MAESGTEAADRVVDVLLLFTEGPATLGVSRIARELGLSKAVVHRILQSLAGRGMVSMDPASRGYRLGAAAAALGARAMRESDLRRAALEVLHELQRDSGETATVTALLPGGRVYLDQVPADHEIKMTVELGRRFALHAGGSGKCMLAFLPEQTQRDVLAGPLPMLTPSTITDPAALRAELADIRELGYAYSAGERQADAASVGAPVFGMSGEVIGAVSVCGPKYRLTDERARQLAPLAVAAAAAISRRMGYRVKALTTEGAIR